MYSFLPVGSDQFATVGDLTGGKLCAPHCLSFSAAPIANSSQIVDATLPVSRLLFCTCDARWYSCLAFVCTTDVAKPRSECITSLSAAMCIGRCFRRQTSCGCVC